MGAAPQQISPDQRVADFRKIFSRAESEVARVIVGHREVVRKLLTALFCGGHILIEGVPGLGKTLMVKAASETLGLSFKRIQFTPDLMPSDIFGTTYVLDPPYIVLATQNPIELEGTYPLPEAQMDRFIFKVVMGSPKPDELREILARTTGTAQSRIQPLFEPAKAAQQIEDLKALVREVMVAEPLERYIISVIGGCTPGGPGAIPEVSQYLRFGPSPRGAQAMILCAKVNALLAGRVSVSYDDIDDAIVPCLRHRLLLNFQAEAENVSSESILEQVTKRLRKPRA